MGFQLFEKLIVNRWVVISALFVSSALSIVGVCSLQFEESTRDVLYSSPEYSAVLDEVEHSFGSDQNACYILLLGSPIFSAEGLAVLREVVAGVAAIEGVERVHSMLDARRMGRMRLPLIPSANAKPDLIARRREEALRHPMVAGHLLSHDANATFVMVRLSGDGGDVSRVQQVISPLEDLLAEATKGTSVSAYVTGLAAVNCEIVRSVRWAMVWFSLTAAAICLSIASYIFRSASAAVVTFTAPVIGCLWVLGLMSFSGVRFNIVHSIMPTLIVVTGFSGAVHLMFHFRSLLRAGIAKREAVERTVLELGPACALASLTTAIGFGSLSLSSLPVIKVFGIACAVGCVLTFVSVIVTFVALTEFARFPWSKGHVRCSPSRWSRWPDALIALVARYATGISLMAVAGVTLAAPMFLSLRPDYQYADSLPIGGRAAKAMSVCDRLFGGSLVAQVLVKWHEKSDTPVTLLPVVNRIHELINGEPQLSPPVSVLNLLVAITKDRNLADDWNALDRLPREAVRTILSKDDRTLIVATRMKDLGSLENSTILHRLRERLNHVNQQTATMEINLTGIPPLVFDSVNQIIRDLSGCLIAASIVIFAVLTLAFRSIRLGLISVIPNAFPVVALSAALVLSGTPLTYTSVLVFTMALGIAVDDTIHLVFRYRRERQVDRPHLEAVRSAYRAVGPAMLTTTTIFTSGFASLWVSDIPQHHSLALLCAVAMILALIGDLLILPALLLASGGEA